MLSMIMGFLSIDPDIPSAEVDTRVDWLGGALVTVGLVLIVYVLSDGEVAPNGWATSCKGSRGCLVPFTAHECQQTSSRCW